MQFFLFPLVWLRFGTTLINGKTTTFPAFRTSEGKTLSFFENSTPAVSSRSNIFWEILWKNNFRLHEDIRMRLVIVGPVRAGTDCIHQWFLPQCAESFKFDLFCRYCLHAFLLIRVVTFYFSRVYQDSLAYQLIGIHLKLWREMKWRKNENLWKRVCVCVRLPWSHQSPTQWSRTIVNFPQIQFL